MMYMRVRLEVVKVSEIMVCKVMMVAMNVRCRCWGSVVIACWLAISISGKSQKDKVSSGAEIWSRFRYMFDDGLRYRFCFRRGRLRKARIKEYEIIVWWRIFGFRMKAVGISMVVAIIIFSITID